MQMLGEFSYVMGYRPHQLLTGGHRFVADDERQAQSLYYRPFGLFALAVLALVIALVPKRPLADGRLPLLIAVMMWGLSAASPLMSIPMMYLMGCLFVTTAFALYVVVVSLASHVFSQRAAPAVAGTAPSLNAMTP